MAHTRVRPVSTQAFDALKADTDALRARLHAGGVLDLRENLLLRHRLLLLSDDVMLAFALYLSAGKFRALGENDFERRAALEAEGAHAPMIYLLNNDEDVMARTKEAVVHMARTAEAADIQSLATAVRELARSRVFYRDAIARLYDLRARKKARQKTVH